MYVVRNLPIRLVTVGPVMAPSTVLPLGALIILPRYVTDNSAVQPFNLPRAVYTLLGDWQRVENIMKPRIWAPSWQSDDFAQFIYSGFAPSRTAPRESAGGSFQLSELPALESRSPTVEIQEYAIVQCYVRTFRTSGSKTLSAAVFSRDAWMQLDDEVWRAGEIRDWLVMCGTRLFILQPLAQTESMTSEAIEAANRLAELIVGAGGPAVLVLTGDPSVTNVYLLDLYAGVLHNQPLSQAARTENNDLDVTLVLGEGADDLLRFDRLIEDVAGGLERYLGLAKRPATTLQVNIECLHSDTKQQFIPHLESMKTLMSKIERNQTKLRDVHAQPWHREHEGIIPLFEIAQGLSEIVEAAGPIAGEGKYLKNYDALEKEIRQAAVAAPRVLNVGFSDPDNQNRVLDANTALAAGREYDLLVDIGPRWDKITSFVTGHAEFPDQALEPGGHRHEIQVLFASSDFEPRVRSARLLLPDQTGRSFPVIDGQSAAEPGPVPLRIRAPEYKPSSPAQITASGRLGVYYRGNLLQSAAVLAWVTSTGNEKLNVHHSVEVDYVLTSTFQELELHFATRKLKYTTSDKNDRHAIAVNLTLNGNGNDAHRILIQSGGSRTADLAPPPAFVPYNPSSATTTLRNIREALLDCFWQRDATGMPQTNKNGLGSDNEKSRDQFQWDLLHLATLGKLLFNMITSHPNVEGDQLDAPTYTRALRKALRSASIIQVARTSGAEYAFPWTLVYDIPLPGPDYEFCRVLREWTEDGRREDTREYLQCPYANQTWHEQNVLCPFGFWGLKHIIEQPISALRQKKDGGWTLRDVASRFGSDRGIDMCIGITRDPQLNQSLIRSHIANLQKDTRLSFLPGTPADTVLGMQNVLQTPSIVYLLCHGKFNEQKQEAYLGVGTPDDHYHQIYADVIQDWSDSPKPPNLESWLRLRPFVFINGCETLQLKPEEALPFLAAFGRAGASGMIGTEVSIRLPLAVEVGESILQGIASGLPAGQVLRETRWKLANKGNLLGLAYTIYARSDLQVASIPESAPAPEASPASPPLTPDASEVAVSSAMMTAAAG